MTPTKACPVVLRGAGADTEILAFRHPVAGLQLVKGTIEPGEKPAQAAVRELAEEAGLHATAAQALGDWPSGHGSHVWSFHLMRCTDPLPETWVHRCADDGGHDFRFFWHRLRDRPGADWHAVYRRALQHLSHALSNGGCDPA
jgi:8-oxo-dGTP pyrophosphatase MutT (NUDIX family)